jgi:hypothetical protein
MSEMTEDPGGRNCPDCGAKPGQLHEGGCDVERCPRCGFQLIGCNCIYIVNGMDPATLDRDQPEVYKKGPTKAMYDVWDHGWGKRRMPWTGLWPGVMECREYNLYSVKTSHGWKPCSKDHPHAYEDLNFLAQYGRWDQYQGRFLLDKEVLARRKVE